MGREGGPCSVKRLIIALIFALLAGIFALQNHRPVQIHLYFWTFPRVSESLLIIASVLLGAVLGGSFAWREHLRQIHDTNTSAPITDAPSTTDPSNEP